MKKALKISNFCVCFHKELTPEESAAIFDTLATWSVGENIMERTMENIKTPDCGSTICNPTERKIIVLIGPQTSKSEMLNTLSHELRHVVDFILEHCPDCELTPAELTGEIASKFADWV